MVTRAYCRAQAWPRLHSLQLQAVKPRLQISGQQREQINAHSTISSAGSKDKRSRSRAGICLTAPSFMETLLAGLEFICHSKQAASARVGNGKCLWRCVLPRHGGKPPLTERGHRHGGPRPTSASRPRPNRHNGRR